MDFQHRNPLQSRLSGFGAARSANHLAVTSRISAVSVLALRGAEAAVAAALQDDRRLRRVGPGEWLLVDPSQTDAALARDLAPRLGDTASLVAQGDGRVLMVLSGPKARAILAKCTPIDLDPAVFAIGQSAQAMFAEVSVNIARTGDDVFEILAMASYAGWVFDEAMAMGREFGLTAGLAAG